VQGKVQAGMKTLVVALAVVLGAPRAFADEPPAPRDSIKECPFEGRISGWPPPAGLSQWCEIEDAQGRLVKNGPWMAWYESGKIKAVGEYIQGKRHGRWLVWNPGGDLISDRKYKFGQLMKEESPTERTEAPAPVPVSPSD